MLISNASWRGSWPKLKISQDGSRETFPPNIDTDIKVSTDWTFTMETDDIHPLIDDLASNIDDLEQTLAPLLKSPLSHQTSKLPLLDQAKLYVLATYAIESLLFSSLRLNGVDAKAHPVFQELSRVKEYFSKIKTAENAGAGSKRNVSLDKEAAGRFIKAGLSGNEKYDRERAEQKEKEKAGAKRKLEEMNVGTHTRFDGTAKKVKSQEGTEEEASSAQDGEEGKRKKRKGRKAPKAANRFQDGYADLMDREAADTASKDDGEVEKGAASDDGSGDSMEAQTPQGKRRKRSEAPKSSKQALESLLEGALDSGSGKSGKKKHKKKTQQKLDDERAEEMK